MRPGLVSCVALALVTGCGRAGSVPDPIEGISLSRQRTISRSELGFRWPLSVGVGTLACDEAGAVLLRNQGETYLVSGRRQGARDISALRLPEPAAPPSNPLGRLEQAKRQEAFRQMTRCDSSQPDRAECRRAGLQRLGLSEAEWHQIDVEGHERRWPPLARESMSLDSIIAAGRELCAPRVGR